MIIIEINQIIKILFGIIIGSFAILGFICFCNLIWYKTSNLRYNFHLKYILKPKFKKGDYAIVPNSNNDPSLVLIEDVFKSWKKHEIEYSVYPVDYPDKYIDYDYLKNYNFLEKDVLEIKKYWKHTWDKKYNKNNEEQK